MAENRRTCASCGAPNEEDARFCEGCGTSLARICATCGVEATATARFCRGCGAPLDARSTSDAPDAGPVRKTVTVMFADLAGSTSFEERVDAETAREVIGGYHDLLRSVAQRHRAGVTKYIGDGFMAVWGVPEIGPEDAVRAVDAAVELQERFVDLASRVTETHGVELALRVAVNTGEVVVGVGDADIVGDALNVCARLESECPRGRVVVGEETWRATRGHYGYESLGEVQVKGRTAPVAVYQWLGRQSESVDAAPFVGRHDEFRRLQATMDNAVSARAARLVTVIGDPGVGKSRLAAEFTGAQTDARVIAARCDVERTVAMAPLVEVLRSTDLETDVPAGIPERDRLLRDLSGLATGEAGSVEENFWALRRFVEVLASERPVVLLLDDIQWADTLLLDFIEHLVEWAADVPVLVLALARPELRELRPELVTVGRFVSEAVHLGGLDPSATAELAANVLGAARLPGELLHRLPSSTGGNPLFVRELVVMLAHDGVLIEEQDGWRLTIDVDAIAVPPTIHALLASRLERLDAADRRVLEIASVVGSEFSLGAVRALAGSTAAGVSLSLNRLRRLELAQPSGAYVGDEPVWRFHHVLIRDVAYRRLLKSDRADLHEQLAGWVETGAPSVAFDSDEMVARHLEAAYTYRNQLGPLDDQSRELAVRSARRYAASARRALDRDELVSAGTQAARGAALAAADEALHADLLLIGCEAYLSAGDVAAGAPLVDELERIADDALAPWATCYRCQFVVYTDPERLLEVEARLHEAIDEFGRRADPAGLAKAHRVRAGARGRLGRIGDSEIDLFEALIAARQSGDHRQITAALGAAPGAALWGPSPVPKAGGRCLDVVRMQRMTTAAPSLEATSLRHLAVLELLRGRPGKARTMLADARQVVADLGLRHGLMETELFAGIIESMEGDPVAAEPHFRTALEGLDALGVGADAGQAAALLARSVLAQGRLDEADRHATESERLAGRNLKTAIAWRAVRAEILAAQGLHTDAASMAREAVTVAAGTDLVLDHADACLALHRVLAAAGDAKGAASARANADSLYAAKEVTARIGRVAAPLAAPPPIETPSKTSRLAVTNQASEIVDAAWRAYRAQDVDGALADFSERFVYDDRRRFSGEPPKDIVGLRSATERARAQYPSSEWSTLAVRGQRLELRSIRMWDDAGNESTTLNVFGVDGRPSIDYWCRFDEDDFEAAYRELDRRYYAGEGAAFAESGSVSTAAVAALNAGNFDQLLGDLSAEDLRIENRTLSAFPDRSADDLRASYGELNAMVASSRAWLSVVRWLSPRWSVSRFERDAVGEDGERYTWTRLLVIDICDGQLASICQFELDDEEAAFAYAEEQAREITSRLAVTNRASATSDALGRASNASDVDAAVASYADPFEFDDRRRLGGDPIHGAVELRLATERLFADYKHFEWRTLAVRGERLDLSWSKCSDDDGNASAHLHVREVDDDGRFIYDGRFDEDDFEGAYRELDRRYYAGEGTEFAEPGVTSTKWTLAVNRGDFDTLFDELTADDFIIENRSRSAFPNRSAAEYRTTLEELAAMVVSARAWISVMSWVSSNWCVARCERDAVGEHGEHYTWHFLIAFEFRDGRVASMCEFELDGEDAAFAYVEDQVRSSTSRLRVGNRASELAESASQALQAHDVDALRVPPSEHFVYDDRRRISGDPIEGAAELQAATERILQSYPHTEWQTMAVRGERLEMHSSRLWDDDGNEATTLNVMGFDNAGQLEYFGRFEEDDFEGAYRELDRRYYAGEGATFAEAGALATEWIVALNRGDYAKAFGELSDPDAGYENRSRSAFPDPSVSDAAASYEDLNAMVASTRTWPSAIRWLSPKLAVSRLDRVAIGRDGERYSWIWILVSEVRDGRFGSSCLFELEDEDAAFAYAEERIQADRARLAVRNQSSGTLGGFLDMMLAHDVAGATTYYQEHFVYDDRRHLSGDPVVGHDAMREGIARVFEHYSEIEFRVLAVRGQRLHLVWNRLSDLDGNESTTFHVIEFDYDSKITYHGRFDEDDFESACRELDKRYYAEEGATFAENGLPASEAMVAMDQNDFDRLFGQLSSPTLRIETRSRRAFPDRTAGQLRAGFEELNTLIASKRIWNSALAWLSPDCSVIRLEREAVGHDGEQYQWTMILVSEHRDGRVTSICEFDPDDEAGAFAYAEERARAHTSRLAVTNQSSEIVDGFFDAMKAHDVEGAIAYYSDQFVYDDHRRLSGDPVVGREAMRDGIVRMLAQYPQYEFDVTAVRGQRVHLVRSCASDTDGNMSSGLTVFETGEGLITYHGRFDEDDLDGAYRELQRRYYSGEGAAFARSGATATESIIALNTNDFDLLLGELSTPDMRVENRTRSAFPDRSITDLRASFGELNSMVTSMRSWLSSECWVSPDWAVVRLEREAFGDSGELYSWTRVLVIGFRDGQMASMCQFELEDEAAAFAYAEERARQSSSRLAVTNRSVQSADRLGNAMNSHDIDEIMRCFSDQLVYDDRRRLTGDPITGRAEFRAAFERILAQYSHFERRVIAVRGDRLNLHRGRWSDDSGNETAYLHVFEMDDDGTQIYEGRFDEDDFDGAYRELEERYYSGEGAEFAAAGLTTTDYAITANQGNHDRLFGELTAPGFHVENRSRSGFPDRSSIEFRASLDELKNMVASVRTWSSAICWLSPTWSVARQEREAVGGGGEHYSWTRLMASEVVDGRVVSIAEFEPDDEDAAFAYAEERAREYTSRLAVDNRASRVWLSVGDAMNARDADAVAARFSDSYVYDDHWALGGDPPGDIRAGIERVFEQYAHFEGRALAVRGDTLQLATAHWSNDDGYETDYLHVTGINDGGLISYYGRFDADDFESAYRELDRRYYAGEGAAFADQGTVLTEWHIAMNQRDFDRVFGELTAPDMRVENRSSSVFGDRTAAEIRTGIEELDAMVDSARSWHSALQWLTPHWVVARLEREAVGSDGEHYAWSWLDVYEFRGRLTSACRFDPDDEDAAFAYAEERVRQAQQR